MVLFINKNNDLIVSLIDKLIVYQSGDVKEIKIPKVIIPSNISENQQKSMENEKVQIVTCNYSEMNDSYVVTTTNKQLVVFDNNFNVRHNLNTFRTVSKVRFLKNGDLLVADKTGDVYHYKFQSDNVEIDLILGHLSMILDVITDDDNEYVITSDRDEKVRVSYFPNSYNIVSYCLGHEEYVSNLELYNSDTLMSASGDGTIRFWDFKSGKQLEVINTKDYIEDKTLISNFLEKMDKATVEVDTLPITEMKSMKIGETTIVICSLYSFEKLLVFSMSGRVSYKFLQSIEIDGDIISFNVFRNELYVLSNKNIYHYKFNTEFVKSDSKELDNFYYIIKELIPSYYSIHNIDVLYKRKYDNVLEYQERKKLRIESKK